jgi:hypothetical protein
VDANSASSFDGLSFAEKRKKAKEKEENKWAWWSKRSS